VQPFACDSLDPGVCFDIYQRRMEQLPERTPDNKASPGGKLGQATDFFGRPSWRLCYHCPHCPQRTPGSSSRNSRLEFLASETRQSTRLLIARCAVEFTFCFTSRQSTLWALRRTIPRPRRSISGTTP
jgi:hypothetical protein